MADQVIQAWIAAFNARGGPAPEDDNPFGNPLHQDIKAAFDAAVAQSHAETTRARLLRERASLFDQSFKAGETPLPDLLRALVAAAQADSAAARQTAALGLARARLQHTLGLLP